MSQQKRILVAPLDWGLGHATRCIPLIQNLTKMNAKVFLAGNGRSAALLHQQFPELELYPLPDYKVRYPENRNLAFSMLLSAPRIFRAIRKERSATESLAEKLNLDIIISDNRFGCRAKKTKNIFITHQLAIQAPFGKSFINRINRNYIEMFDECWVPDHAAEDNLSGALTKDKNFKIKIFFIGPQSRFTNNGMTTTTQKGLLVILSGPEPQRTIFEKKIMGQLAEAGLSSTILAGKPENYEEWNKGNIRYYSHLPDEKFAKELQDASLVISRSGYSTIMDLQRLQKKAIFIPTPGQTEQEYLSELLMKKKIAFSMSQDDFKLQTAIEESKKYPGFKKMESKDDPLHERLSELLRLS